MVITKILNIIVIIFRFFLVNIIIANSSNYELIVAGIFLCALLIQLYYYLFVFLRVGVGRRKKTLQKSLPPVSVIICARNEADNLRNFLPKILSQDYPDFEVVVVNDCSCDDTQMLLSLMKQQHNNLRTTNINEDAKFVQNKKLALTVGIKSAKNECLLFTDADCMPESEMWLRGMVGCFVENVEMVVGYGGYQIQRGLLNKLIRFDALFNAMKYLGFALKRRPYRAVGRNLAYTKTLFFRNRGFASHANIVSGDDDLFVRDAANRRNTAVCIDPNTVTRAIPETTYARWIAQKRRQVSTTQYYKKGAKVRNALEPLSRFMFWAAAITLMVWNYHLYIVLAIIALRMLVQFIVIKIAMIALNETKILLISPFWDFYSLFLYAKIHLLNLFTSTKPKWR